MYCSKIKNKFLCSRSSSGSNIGISNRESSITIRCSSSSNIGISIRSSSGSNISISSRGSSAAYSHPFAVHRSRPRILADFVLNVFFIISAIS